MNILIVGAGAVGLVYGRHFAEVGHKVSFFVKAKYQQALEDNQQNNGGERLYLLNKDREQAKPILFDNFNTVTEWNSDTQYDLIVLAISSNALRALPLENIKQQLGSNTLLMLQPSQTDFEHLSTIIEPEKIVQGMISLISYQTPLPNHTYADNIPESGIAYYLPPMKMPISGLDHERAATVKNLFKGAKIPAKTVSNAVNESKLPSAFLMTFLCVLEAADWKFSTLANSKELLKKLATGQQELLPQQVSNSDSLLDTLKQGLAKLIIKLVLRPWLYQLLLKISDKAVPLPLEAYLEYHFSKVREQTKIYMEEYAQSSNEAKKLLDLLE